MTGYSGIYQDEHGGMTHLGRIVMDAWVFGLIPESESCAGWDAAQMQILHESVFSAWEPHGHLPSRLPAALRDKHAAIYQDAVARAKQHQWDAELDDDE